MEAAVRWSPHSAGDQNRFLIVDVIDQSLTLNHITHLGRKHVEHRTVARYGRLPNFSAFDWSKVDESIIALGLVSGSACLVKLREDDQPSETVATFRSKQQRKCNSVALSTQNWLAVALDKTRADVCLNIFDANRDPQTLQDPIRRLCPAELVSSVRFFSHQPQELIVAAQRSFIRLYDLRDGFFGTGSSGSAAQVSTRNVHNISIDPLDENYFASAGSTGDPSMTVWDRRWIAQAGSASFTNGAVFDFKPAVDPSSNASIWSLRYSGVKRGRLAMCSSNGELKVIDMVEGVTLSSRATEYLPVNANGGVPWACNRYVSQVRKIEEPPQSENGAVDDRTRLIAFDWISTTTKANEQAILALRPSREVNILQVPCSIPLANVTPRNDFSLAMNNIQIAQATEHASVSLKSQTANGYSSTAEDFGPWGYESETFSSSHGEVPTGSKIVLPSSVGEMLAPSLLPRERCRQGYLFDCQKNIRIVAGNAQLERFWEMVDRFRQAAADEGMVGEDLDLSYIGVFGIWWESIGPSPHRNVVSGSTARIEETVISIVTRRDLPNFEGVRTDFPEHRQLCLAMCGWHFTLDELEADCEQLIEGGLHYQAIVQAMLHDRKHVALNMLRTMIRNKTVPNIGLGPLMAADSLNTEQRDMCHWMAADTDNAALKAILTYLASGSWRDLLEKDFLPLSQRITLALRILIDTELSKFIRAQMMHAIAAGDLDGIVLTGLAEPAMDLLQAYITRTNDLQTAVLASAFTNPLFVNDLRWEMWKETYFSQMQVWRAFIERTHFVVQHNTLLARTRDGRSLVPRRPAQVTLRCLHCQASLARRPDPSVLSNSATQHSRTPTTSGSLNPHPPLDPANATNPSLEPSRSAGIVCLQCGRHMPRCGICQLWLGTPDPSSSSSSSKTSSSRNKPTFSSTSEHDPVPHNPLDDLMAKFLTFCVSCGHGFHAHHARSWFAAHRICPVPDCRCACMRV